MVVGSYSGCIVLALDPMVVGSYSGCIVLALDPMVVGVVQWLHGGSAGISLPVDFNLVVGS